jgi:L-fuculose-phosphate aldolase
MMDSEGLRNEICGIGRRLWAMGHTPANAGNISVRLDAGRILITPTCVSKGDMRPDELVVMTLDGQVVGTGQASSEARMHLAIYEQRAEVVAVVHVHPPAACGFAASGTTLPCDLLSESADLLGAVPTVPFARPGTDEVAEGLRPYLVGSAVAFLLGNHGAVTVGSDLREAYHRMEILEHTAQVALNAQILGPRSIPIDSRG